MTNTLQEPLVCRYVRLMPQTWNGHISLRMELLGIGPVTGMTGQFQAGILWISTAMDTHARIHGWLVGWV